MGRLKGTREAKNLPPTPLEKKFKLEAFVLPAHVAQVLEPGTAGYKMGGCTIFTSPPAQDQGWHMSISHEHRYPTWDEIAFAWYNTVPEAASRTGALVLPPIEEYINIHEHCMQVHEVLNRRAAGLSQ